jgi:hypothetical protein
MAASKRDTIQAGIDESERELMDLAFVIGPMKRYLERLDEHLHPHDRSAPAWQGEV